LHYYFPTKEDLILTVGGHLEAGYIQARTAGRPSPASTPLVALRQELADAAFFRKERPLWRAVSREFAARAPRDPAAAAVMERLTTGWCRSVETVLREGIAEGVFRADLNPRGASTMIVSSLWAAATFLTLSDTEFRALCRALEQAVVRQ
jgi:AcrR family transcriptional regulator